MTPKRPETKPSRLMDRLGAAWPSPGQPPRPRKSEEALEVKR